MTRRIFIAIWLLIAAIIIFIFLGWQLILRTQETASEILPAPASEEESSPL
ncbi:hypothetical protein GTO10_05170 [Candidatus Saccharibacteria bacterium]|nr:hypothetical protein [Candidatus Saccharibacteria bacterium]